MTNCRFLLILSSSLEFAKDVRSGRGSFTATRLCIILPRNTLPIARLESKELIA